MILREPGGVEPLRERSVAVCARRANQRDRERGSSSCRNTLDDRVAMCECHSFSGIGKTWVI